MSDYLRALDPITRARYTEKLQLVGLSEDEDPYELWKCDKFDDDMTRWPPIEYGHIFCYFIERPGVFTKQELLQWKSLEAYNYFQSGHVRDVRLYRLSAAQSCVMMAFVNPSQNAPDKAHHAWLGVRSDGSVITAHCTCMAGLGEGCSHAAAVLFKVECAVRNGYTSVTSNLCGWNQVFTTKHEPAKIIDIDFSQPKMGNDGPPADSNMLVDKSVAVCVPPTAGEQKAFVLGLQKLFPKAAVINVFLPKENPDCQPVTKKLPRMITSYYHPRYKKLSQSMLQQESQRVFEEELKVTDAESKYLVKCTRLQAQSTVWFEHRRGRLTASRFGAICRTSVVKPAQSLVTQILRRNSTTKSAALAWGIEMESKARQEYEETMKIVHTSFKVENTGLHINPEYPHLGASPDGLTSCTCCGDGILEIKCPYSLRDSVPTNAPYLHTSLNGEYELSTAHEYYYQVQGQLGITGRPFCDFVCWTPRDAHVERIMYNPAFFVEMELKLQRFFVSVILPRVLCGEDKENVQHPSELTGVFCYCRKGEMGKMVLCDSPDCKHGWYHFPCVNLSSPPTDAWFCPDCRY